MTTNAMTAWLKGVIDGSIAARPITFDRAASAGILNDLGFTATTTVVKAFVPSFNFDTATADLVNQVIVLVNQVGFTGTPDNAGEEYLKIHRFRIEVLWVADAKGNPQANINPVYTGEASPVARFNRFCDGLEKTLFFATTVEKSAGQYRLIRQGITDSVTSEQSCVHYARYPISGDIASPEPRDSGMKLYFSARMNCQFQERLY